MVHSGYEATAVNHGFGSLAGFVRMVKLSLLGIGASKPVPGNGSSYPDGAPVPVLAKGQGCGSGSCNHHHDIEEELETVEKA